MGLEVGMELEFENSVLAKLRRLPPEKQREVLDFVEFLERKNAPSRSLQNPQGAFADLRVSLSADEIDQTRQEAWGEFPRADV